MHQQFFDDQAAAGLLSRREVIGGGLLLSALALSGCNNSTMRVPTATASAVNSSPVTPYIPGPMPSAPTPAQRAAGGGSVPVIPRSAWTRTGRIAGRKINDMGRVTRITVHHEGDDPFTATSQAAVASRLESIRQFHTTRTKQGRPSEKWADIGYHYIIDPAGRVWEGRDARYQGAHVQDQNENNLAVMVLGNFDRQQVTPAARTTLDAFVADRMRHYSVVRARVYTHRELNPTQCPGRNLQSYMVTTRARGGRLAVAAAEMGLA
ncbi:MAG: N-acetylmuramoyl-L-alanine amidase [Phycisphaerales bacterium]|nr:N-acetylmuramoyl-L-alanine amidase [Phycisphaerales bacterium]